MRSLPSAAHVGKLAVSPASARLLPEIDGFFTERWLADFLCVPLPTMKAWRRAGRGPRFFRVGRGVRYLHTDVEAWLLNRVGGGAP